MGALCQIWLTLVHWFYSGRFKNKIYVFSLFSHIGEGGLLSVRQTLIPYTQGYFIPSLVENYSVVLKKLKTKSMYFRYFVIISSCKSAGHLNWTNVNPLHPWMFFLKFSGNWPSGFGEEDFYSIYFWYFFNISHWKKADLSFEQSSIPFTQRYFVQSSEELCWIVLKIFFLYFRDFFSMYVHWMVIISPWK